jgi:membrane protein DedA with SNARE-associated domain
MPDFGELIDRFLRWLEPFYATYGYGVVILGALLEHTFFLAWALPGGILVAIGGLYSQSGPLALPVVILCAALGFTLGDHLDFLVGRRGTAVIDRVTKGRRFDPGYIWSVRALPALLLAYTNTIPRAALFMGGAASGLTYPRFLALSLGLALFWGSVFSVLGYWLGAQRDQLTTWLQRIGIGGQVLLLAAVAIGVLIYRRRKRGRSNQEVSSLRPPSGRGPDPPAR